ncbi:pullulanase [Proteiniclasticum ruminis]|uniref:pullulanase n=2 Tax=Proteiniclasticum ruminis TaxID=398199 RepID=A0A1I5AWR7_9CLOT|nr:pullulanase [Proteiniclasticum ruminis]
MLLLMLLLLSPILSLGDVMDTRADNEVKLTVHYQRKNQDYEGWNLWLWAQGGQGEQLDFTGEDDFGKILEVTKSSDSGSFGFIVRKENWEEKDVDKDRFMEVSGNEAEIWLVEGDETIYTEEPVKEIETPALPGELTLKVHYRRFDENYEGWNLWIWPKGGEGAAYEFTSTDEYGAVAEIPVVSGDAEELGIIIRKGEWEAKDVDMDRFIPLSKAKEGVLNLYLLEKDATLYYALEEVDLSPKILKSEPTTVNKIKVNLSVPMTLLHDREEGLKIVSGEEELEIEAIYFSEGGRPETSSSFEILLKEPLELGKSYQVVKEGYGEKEILMSGVFSTSAFEKAYHYDGELGALHEKEQTIFRLWAPTASNVTLNLFQKGDTVEAFDQVTMEKKEQGVYETVVSGDLDGIYYTYSVENLGLTQEAVDPYARAVGVNGQRAMVIDLARTNPEGFQETEKPEYKEYTDAVIYELHVRDLSISEDSGIEHKGKFLGLTENGTKGPGGVSTGLDHLVELGITHLHLLPSFDFRSIDETKLAENNFNWGYDPQHFNVPEGSYSTNPYEGEVRIREFKEMVAALHEKDIRVVMDVVYNHTGASGDSDFSKIVPGYYYRMNEDGSFSNGSGTGNETASERSMMRKYIVDSVVYWATEYKVDGFRFDLMALHDIETMKAVREALNEVDPTILIYGEGWTGGDSPLPDKEKALKRNTWRMEGIAAFSDDIRDGIKGHVFTDEDRGFVNGGEALEESIKFGVVASIDHPGVDYQNVKYSKGFWAKEPSQTITYVEAHDNLTLWDKLAISNPDESEEERQKMHRMANAMVMTSQGIPFLHAGSEFLRTKDGNHNSYNAPDEINRFVWARKAEYQENVEYMKGLIAFRKEHPAFRMAEAEMVRANLSFLEMPDRNMVGYKIEGEAVGDSFSEILVLMNANAEVRNYALPEGTYEVYVDGENAGTEVLRTEKEEVEVPGRTLLVLSKSAGNSNPVPEGDESGNPMYLWAALFLGAGLIAVMLLERKKNLKKAA